MCGQEISSKGSREFSRNDLERKQTSRESCTSSEVIGSMAHLSEEKRALGCDCRSRNGRSSRPRIPRHLDRTACYSLRTRPSTRAPGRSAPYRNTWEQFTSLPHQNYSPCRPGEKPGLLFSNELGLLWFYYYSSFFFLIFYLLYIFFVVANFCTLSDLAPVWN